jgi:hypothetical protein
VVNRSRLRGHAFLGGEGLQHFPPGLHRIHGVPFDVLDETERGDASVLSVACGSAHTSQGKTLPERVRIPVGYRAAALYFLHAAGWVQGGETCVTHTINYEGRSRHTLPIVPLGYRSYQPNSGDSSGTEPNIQDWWRDYPRFNSGTARHCVITRDGDPLLYERYLYTLEWVNPHPERAIRSITMRARSNSASYALIALTVLEPEEP